MASTFPGAIDSFTDPLANSSLASPSHAGQHSDLNDAVEKIETYMGLVKVIPTAATNGTVAANGTVTIGNAVSSVSVTCFSALYDAYRIIVSGGSCSASPAFSMTLGATATGYYSGGLFTQMGVGTATGLQVSNGTAWTNMGRTSAGGHSLIVDVFEPFATRSTGMSMVSADYIVGGYYIAQTGFLNNSTSYTAFTLTPTGGTLTGGSIRVYGYRN